MGRSIDSRLGLKQKQQKQASDLIRANDDRLLVIFQGLVDGKRAVDIARSLPNTTLDQVRRAIEKYDLRNRVEVANRQALDAMQLEFSSALSVQQIKSMTLLQPKLVRLSEMVDNILERADIEDIDAIKYFCRLLELHAKVTGADKSSGDTTNVNVVYQQVMDAAARITSGSVVDLPEEKIELIE